jgi:hypothetical protein
VGETCHNRVLCRFFPASAHRACWTIAEEELELVHSKPPMKALRNVTGAGWNRPASTGEGHGTGCRASEEGAPLSCLSSPKASMFQFGIANRCILYRLYRRWRRLVGMMSQSNSTLTIPILWSAT